MKTEREAFKAWVLKHPDNLNITSYEESIMFDAWQASASREGYKLVPVNPTDEMINTYRDKSIAPISTLSVIGYKAMIGAAP